MRADKIFDQVTKIDPSYARTRVSSTSDPFELDPVEADEAEVALPRLEVAEALRLAERYASYVVKSRRKALVTPKREVLEQRLVYKPFWIVDCAEAYTLLVDGVTGGFHPLNGSASKLG